jgi:hypothetical protein
LSQPTSFKQRSVALARSTRSASRRDRSRPWPLYTLNAEDFRGLDDLVEIVDLG